jgi:Pyruvate/2-oxoacid:ferredoxin oxidoreductase delta subunit
MVAASSSPLRVVVYEGAGSRSLSSERRRDLLGALLKKGYQVTCATGDGEVSPPDSSDLVVLSERDDGDEAAFPFAGNMAGGHSGDSQEVQVHFRDIAGVDVEGVVGAVDDVRTSTESYEPGAWKPWFPVIDFDRCTNCMQCLSFCLFDVYGVDDDKNIQVTNPDKCKTNCPACSRVCPEVAILFPKYGSGPINGDQVNQEDVDREKMKVDISALLGGDIYSMLRERHERAQTRFSKERDESKALKERQKCLKKLQGDVDIPAEVLMALPSLDEIKRKAEEAAKKGEDARQAREER